MISSFEFPQLWEANSDIQLLIAMHEMDLAVLWQTSYLQELITVLYFSLGILVHQKCLEMPKFKREKGQSL